MPNPVVFWEIVGPDADRLRDFYAAAFGWLSSRHELVPSGYHYLSTDGVTQKQGGIRQEVDDAPERVLYIGVPDVQSALDAVVAAGGTVIFGPIEQPGVPRFALFKDPAGNPTGVIEQASA